MDDREMKVFIHLALKSFALENGCEITRKKYSDIVFFGPVSERGKQRYLSLATHGGDAYDSRILRVTVGNFTHGATGKGTASVGMEFSCLTNEIVWVLNCFSDLVKGTGEINVPKKLMCEKYANNYQPDGTRGYLWTPAAYKYATNIDAKRRVSKKQHQSNGFQPEIRRK